MRGDGGWGQDVSGPVSVCVCVHEHLCVREQKQSNCDLGRFFILIWQSPEGWHILSLYSEFSFYMCYVTSLSPGICLEIKTKHTFCCGSTLSLVTEKNVHGPWTAKSGVSLQGRLCFCFHLMSLSPRFTLLLSLVWSPPTLEWKAPQLLNAPLCSHLVANCLTAVQCWAGSGKWIYQSFCCCSWSWR